MKDGKWRIESHESRKKALIQFAKATWCNYDEFYVSSATAENITENIEEIEDEEDNFEEQ